MQPRIPEVLRTASGKIELAPRSRSWPTWSACARRSSRHRNGGMVLIGRRQLRSNNSWMHNLEPLVKGKDRCTMHVHPADAERLGLADGGRAHLRSRGGEIDGAGRGDRRDHAGRRERSRTAGATARPAPG